jgi:hypothetical protein
MNIILVIKFSIAQENKRYRKFSSLLLHPKTARAKLTPRRRRGGASLKSSYKDHFLDHNRVLRLK